MATSPGSNVSSVSNVPNPIPASLLPAVGWMPLPPREKQPGAAAPTQARKPLEWATDREQVLLDTLPLVRYVAHRIHERLPQHVELDDLVSAGVVGLIDAYNKFDAGKNVLFRTYAQSRIQGAILDSLRDLDWAPRELRRKAREMEEATRRLLHRLNRGPEQSEVANELGMTPAAYQELRHAVKGMEIVSLQETRTEGSLEEELVYIETDPEDDPLRQYLRGERAAHLSAAVAELPEREQRVLQLYYVDELTLKQIGVVLGVVESRVSQIRMAAIQQLRSRFTGEEAEAESVKRRLIA